MTTSTQPAIEKPFIRTLRYGYLVFSLAIAFAPELMVVGLWIVDIRPQRFGDSYMWPGSWGWAVLLAFSFGLILGFAAIVGVAVRAGFVQYKSGFRAAWPGWLTLLACVAAEVMHFHGYIGWKHIMKT